MHNAGEISTAAMTCAVLFTLFVFIAGTRSFLSSQGYAPRRQPPAVEQAGHAKVAFHGLPSPSSGMTLATFYPFSQTPFFQAHLAGLPWSNIMIALMVVLGLLMMSHILYPVVPKFGFRSAKGILTFCAMLAAVAAALTIPALFFFPALIAYIAYGVFKSLALGFFERLPERDPMLDEEGGDEAGAELRDIDYDELTPHRRSWRGRWRRPGRGESE